MDRDELKQRTKQLALRVMRLVDALPHSAKGRAISSQLVRSGTSVAANYRAACRGRSRAEFIAKIGVAEEEADETALWLELIMEDELLKPSKVQPLLDEARELVALFAATYISAHKNTTRNGTSVRKSAIRHQQSEIQT